MRTWALLAGLLVFVGTDAEAKPRMASKGPYAEAGIGATQFIGTGKSYSAIGPSFAIRVGYDLFSWLSVGGRVETSSHEATIPPPPEQEYYQLYTGAAEVRLGVNVWRLGLFADAGIGYSYISTNVLEKVAVLDPGEKTTLTYSAGGGLEYQLQNRHYALGLAGSWSQYSKFGDSKPPNTVTGRAYLRYTY